MVKASENATIMVVDDTPANLNLLQEMLQTKGYLVRTFPRGAMALQAAAKNPPDLILLDIQMPEMNGFEVCRQLKADAALADIPVLFISALTETTDKIRAFAVGGVDYVSKPFHFEEVNARVETHLRLRRLQSEVEFANLQLVARNVALDTERAKAKSLLRNILPEKVIVDLEKTGQSEPETFLEVTVLFTDFVGFTKKADGLEPKLLIAELNEMFTAFDAIVTRNGCERIKTIGDAYLAVCGMAKPDARHAGNIVQSALEIMDYLRKRNASERCCGRLEWQARAGIASGPVVGGIVGNQKFIYDVFGDTINTASRMEKISPALQITLAESTRARIGESFALEALPCSAIKGKQTATIYRVIDV